MASSTSLSVSLLTPASDLITSADGVDLNLIFGRGGSNIYYPYDPITAPKQTTKIDIIFGSLFDNGPDEFSVIQQIEAGNNFAILNTTLDPKNYIIPRGKNTFVLGDAFQSYYTEPNPLDLLTTDPLGTNQFAVIYDFQPGVDTIQLHGKKENYQLVQVNNLTISGISGVSGYALFSIETGVPD
ncbi:MAG: hypothetical protein WCA35_03490, partial [Kovacikia sp.]